MLKNPLAWLGAALLIALAAIWDFSPEDLMRDDPAEQERFPEAYLIESETRLFDAEGRLHYHLTSERADQFQQLPDRASDLDYSLIVKPRLSMYGETDDPWHLHADMGQSNADGDRIKLWDNVRAWQDTGAGRNALTTPELVIFPARQFAETDKAVKMRSPQGVTDAVGMRADLEQDTIELLSQVRGTYESNRGESNRREAPERAPQDREP